MIGYKIRLFSHLPLKIFPGYHYFLFFSRSGFYDIFKDLETLETRAYLKFTSAFDKEEDLDLFKAKTVHKKLTELGVNCTVVKVDYKGQTFEQINWTTYYWCWNFI